MKKKFIFNIFLIIIFIIVLGGMILSLLIKNYYLALIPAFTGLICLFILENKFKNVIEDERSKFINEKVDSATLNIFFISSIAIFLILLVIARNTGNRELEKTGMILIYPVIFLLLVNLAVQFYYSIKYGEYDKNDK